MKKLIACGIILLLQFVPQISKAEIVPTRSATLTNSPLSDSKLINRLDEIRAMDKSKMNSAEKKALRKELRETKAQARNSSGIYISVGALLVIIIILLLI